MSIAPSLILLPDILKISIASFDKYLNYWWPSLLLFHDYLRDVYLYAEEGINRYRRSREDFEKLIVNYYQITEEFSKEKDEKTAHLFTSFDAKLSFSEVIIFLMNVHIMCWNAISDTAFSGKFSRIEHPVEYIEAMLHMEKEETPTMIMTKILKQELINKATVFPKLMEPWHKICMILVSKTEQIIGYLNKSLIKIMEEPVWGSTITEEEAHEIVKRRLAYLKELWEREGGDPSYFSKIIEDLERGIYKIVSTQYKIKRKA